MLQTRYVADRRTTRASKIAKSSLGGKMLSRMDFLPVRRDHIPNRESQLHKPASLDGTKSGSDDAPEAGTAARGGGTPHRLPRGLPPDWFHPVQLRASGEINFRGITLRGDLTHVPEDRMLVIAGSRQSQFFRSSKLDRRDRSQLAALTMTLT